jgi:hypothetical protein
VVRSSCDAFGAPSSRSLGDSLRPRLARIAALVALVVGCSGKTERQRAEPLPLAVLPDSTRGQVRQVVRDDQARTWFLYEPLLVLHGSGPAVLCRLEKSQLTCAPVPRSEVDGESQDAYGHVLLQPGPGAAPVLCVDEPGDDVVYRRAFEWKEVARAKHACASAGVAWRDGTLWLAGGVGLDSIADDGTRRTLLDASASRFVADSNGLAWRVGSEWLAIDLDPNAIEHARHVLDHPDADELLCRSTDRWLLGDAAGDELFLVDAKFGRVISTAPYRDDVGEPWCRQQFAGVVHVDPSNDAVIGTLCSGDVCSRLRRLIPDDGGRLLGGAAGLIDAGLLAAARDKTTGEAVIAVGDVGGFREVRRYDDPSRMMNTVKAVPLAEGILLVGGDSQLSLIDHDGRPQHLALSWLGGSGNGATEAAR